MYIKEGIIISKFLPYGKQNLDQKDIDAVINVLNDDFITQGPRIQQFEENIAKYVGAKYAVAFNSGTSALHGAYHALGINKNDEMITTANTFVATANAGLYNNIKVNFADVEANTGNIDVECIDELVNSNTKLITPVHYSGNPVDLCEISKIAKENNIYLIEDGAHALGAIYDNDKIGSLKYSDMAMFSFHPVKHITTGEGGIIVTNNEEYAEKLKTFRSHGITKENLKNTSHGDWYYEMHDLGFNYRITDIQCALGISQLKKLDSFVKNRREIAKKYNEMFEDNPYFDVVYEKPKSKSAYHLYPILLKNELKPFKKEIFSKLRANGLGVQVHYIPVYLQPYYEKLGYKKGLNPVCEDFYQREISIPMYPSLTDDDLEFVNEVLFKVLSNF